jgi:hypothetical protein
MSPGPEGTISARSSLIRYAQVANKHGLEMSNLVLFPPEESKASVRKAGEKGNEQGDLDELRDFGKSIYLTYFIRDCAPLELNIGDRSIGRVVRDLKIRETKEKGGPICLIEHTPNTINLFDAAEHECLQLLYDNVYRPFCAKIQMADVLKNQERLKSLHSGDVLPWQSVEESWSTTPRCGTPLDYTVILPEGSAGGASTRRLKLENEREQYVSRSPTPDFPRSQSGALKLDSSSSGLLDTIKDRTIAADQHERRSKTNKSLYLSNFKNWSSSISILTPETPVLNSISGSSSPNLSPLTNGVFAGNFGLDLTPLNETESEEVVQQPQEQQEQSSSLQPAVINKNTPQQDAGEIYVL